MGLRSDRALLRTQLRKIDEQQDELDAFNRRLDDLIEEIRDSIVSDNVENLVDAVEDLRDRAGASGRDSDLNNASGRIQNEIAVISAAIRAQEEAARAMREAASKT